MKSLLSRLVLLPAGTPSKELDEVLFYWREVAPHLKNLNSDWAAFLRREISRTKVVVTFRVVGADKKSRIDLKRAVTIGERTHLQVDRAKGVRPPTITLTMERTGLTHIWVRL